ncbi:MAG: hypothetical protein HZA92_08160 [Verrucomicrobia bacterium]|nr:hypothetical protein [Verrucomicrobiota bacterium]
MRIGLGKQKLRVGRFALKVCVAVVGILALAAVAEEKPANQVLTAVSSTTLSGYVSSSAYWNPSPKPVPGVSFLGFTNGHAQVLLEVMSGRTNRVEVSTNLVTWEAVGTVAVPNPASGSSAAASVSLTHSNASQLPRFYYRVAELP